MVPCEWCEYGERSSDGEELGEEAGAEDGVRWEM
jgi:hypothetical protein